jgi:hypothetical protein
MDLESAPLNEQINNIVNGYAKTQFFDLYNKFLTKETKTYPERPKIINNNIIINETLTSTIEKLSELVNKNSELDKLLDE